MVLEVLKGIGITFYEALCCVTFLEVFLRKRKESRITNLLSVLLLTCSFIIIGVSTYFGEMYVIRSVVTILCIFGISLLFYTGKWLMRLFLCGMYYGLLVCIDYIAIILTDIFLDRALLENDVIQMILVLLCKTILLLIVILVSCFWKKHEILQVKTSEWILMLGFPVFTVGTMLVMLFSFQKKNSSAGYLLISIGMVIMNVIMFVLLRYISEREQKFYQMKLLQERNKEKMQAYYEISASYENQKRMLHDYSNQLGCIQGLLKEEKYQEAKHYTEKLTDCIHEGMEVVDVKNPVLNVVLNQKYRLASQKEIAILFHMNDLSDVWLEEQDIVILLSNLLDNAIEACEKIKKERIIRLKLVM